MKAKLTKEEKPTKEKRKNRFNDRQLKVAMDLIIKLHPISQSLNVTDIFPVIRFLCKVKRNTAWDTFYENYEQMRLKSYKAPGNVVTPRAIYQIVENAKTKKKSKDTFD